MLNRPVLLVTVLALSCSESAGTSGSTPVEGGSGGDDGGSGSFDASFDAPTAQGDPCRGTSLPTAQHYVAPGMCARMVASGLGQLRQLTFAPNGDLYGVSRDGVIHRMHDANANGIFESGEITDYATTGGNGNNCHFDGGFLYAGGLDGVKRFPWDASRTSGGPGEDVVVGQPADGHNFHTTHVYDGFLYVHSGSAGNAVNDMAPAYDTARSLLRRFDLSKLTPGTPFAWLSGEVYVSGLRNMVGYTKNAYGRMYGVVNGLDDIHYQGADVHEDNPGEQIVFIEKGKQYGYPFCFTAQRVVVGGQAIAPGTQLGNADFSPSHDDAWCAANSVKPTTFVQAHSAPLDIVFFDRQPKGALPERWRGGAFVSLHGSWDRTPATGYKVVWIPFDAQGSAPMPTSTATTTTFPYEIVFGGGNTAGPRDGRWQWSMGGDGEAARPVGVAISPIDGALYVSSDTGGIVYRIGTGH